jgi:hypothetical protein
MGLAVHVQTSFGVVSLMEKGLVLQFIDYPGFPFHFIVVFTLIFYDKVCFWSVLFSVNMQLVDDMCRCLIIPQGTLCALEKRVSLRKDTKVSQVGIHLVSNQGSY